MRSNIQKTSWGYIDWFGDYDGGGSTVNNIGICVILPGQCQQPHIHYGADQFIYILEGESLQVIDGVECTLNKGMHLFMKAGVTHETVNVGQTPILELLVSTPVVNVPVPAPSENPAEIIDDGALVGNIYAAVEALRTQLTESIHAPYAIHDEESRLIMQNNLYSQFCVEHCAPNDHPDRCQCLIADEADMRLGPDHRWFVCRHGLVVYHYPVIYQGRRLGRVRGGHIVVSELSGDYGLTDIYDTPLSTALGIQNMLGQIVRSLLAYCEFDRSRSELTHRNNLLLEKEARGKVLEQTLRLARETVTNLRINHHFLFNTLNCMAGMALQNKGKTLYSAIISLSQLFRYVMPSERRFVPLDEELANLDNYLTLQKLRHENNLTIDTQIEVDPGCLQIPFNCLQPVAENAFTHGFKDVSGLKRLIIHVFRRDHDLVVEVANNGRGLDQATAIRVKNGLSSNSGHGLSLIYNKLQSAYGDNFSLDLHSDRGGLTRVILTTPLTWVGPAAGSYGLRTL